MPGALCCKAVKAATILHVCLFAQKYSQSSAPYLPLSLRLSVPLGGDPDSPQTFCLVLVVLIPRPRGPLHSLAVSQTAAGNGLRLPRSCLLDVTFLPSCLGAIQVTLPELHTDRFMILCNTAEPEINYRDLSTEHLPAFPHMLSFTARFYPLSCFTFHCHLLFFHYLSFLHFIQYFISTTNHQLFEARTS